MWFAVTSTTGRREMGDGPADPGSAIGGALGQRLAIDIGGTFTDLVALDARGVAQFVTV